MKPKKIWDEICPWPYHASYGWVAPPKVKKPRKPRKPKVKFKLFLEREPRP